MKSPEQTKETVPGEPPVRTEEIHPLPSEHKEISMISAPASQSFQQEIAPMMQRRPNLPDHRASRRTMVLGLGLAGLALGGGGITWFVTQYPVPHRATITLLPKVSLTATPTPAATPIPLGTILSSYNGHGDVSVTVVAWSPNGRYIASASLASTVQVSNAATGGHVYTYRGHSGYLYAVAWSPDGRRIASGGDDKTVQVWDTTNGGHVYTYRGHLGSVNTIAWSHDGKWIASGAGTDFANGAAPFPDHTVQVWNATTGNIHFSYRGHVEGVNVIAWSPNGRWIASGSDDKTVQVWNATNGDHVCTYRGHAYAVVTLAWSPDSKRIISSDHKTVQAWYAIDGAIPYIYGGDLSSASWLAWSPIGQRIASCDFYGIGSAQLWDAADGGHPYIFDASGRDISFGSVFAVAWSPEGKRIAQVGNGPVLVWVAG